MDDIWVRHLNNIFVGKVCIQAQFDAYIVNTMTFLRISLWRLGDVLHGHRKVCIDNVYNLMKHNSSTCKKKDINVKSYQHTENFGD